jgi:ATP-dependent protease ClpP protease subunit
LDTIARISIDGEIKADNWLANHAAIRDTLGWQRPFDKIEMTINSYGGDFTEALAMFDEILSFNVPVKTHVIGQCCSSATVLFMAGTERTISENATFMIHRTKGGGWGGDAEEIRNYANLMESYNERMASIYAKGTGLTDEAITEYMSKDSYFTPEEALAAGFATAIIKPIVAKATAFITAPKPAETTPPAVEQPSTSSTQAVSTMKILKTKQERIKASFEASQAKQPIVAKKVTTEDGTELTINTVDGGDNYAEGDDVMVGEEAAKDGTYKVGNVTIVVKDGKIESLSAEESTDPPSAEGGTGITASADGDETAELETLRADNTRLTNENNDLKTRFGRVEAQMKIMLGTTESKEVNVPTGGKGKSQNIRARGDAPDKSKDELEREAMHQERVNRGKGITPAATE